MNKTKTVKIDKIANWLLDKLLELPEKDKKEGENKHE